MKKTEFRRAGVNAAGEAVFDLWLNGEPARRGLTIDEVAAIINRAEDLAKDSCLDEKEERRL